WASTVAVTMALSAPETDPAGGLLERNCSGCSGSSRLGIRDRREAGDLAADLGDQLVLAAQAVVLGIERRAVVDLHVAGVDGEAAAVADGAGVADPPRHARQGRLGRP